MKKFLSGLLFWLGTGLMYTGYQLLELSKKLIPVRKKVVKKNFKLPPAELTEVQAPEPRPCASSGETPEESKTTEEQLPVFRNSADQPIAVSRDLEDLPDLVVFRAMFERKYGKFGVCSMTIGGQPRVFSCEELYILLHQIRMYEKPEPLLIALYGTVLTVIMHAHGEEQSELSEMN